MTNDTRVQTVQDLIGALVASWPEGYAGIRAVLEELVEALSVQGPHGWQRETTSPATVRPAVRQWRGLPMISWPTWGRHELM